MIVGYARVSTRSDEQALSVEAQVEQLLAAGCERVIQERRSAYKEGSRRPGWDELQAMVASGVARKVIAVSMSRLTRREEATPFLRMCSRKGVEVQFLDGTPSDVNNPADRLMTGVLEVVNEVDSQIKSINTRNGLARRREAGHYACGRVPFGYVYDGSQVVPHPERFADAQLLWQRLESNEFNIAGTLRAHGYTWSTRGLRRWIHNPMLRGIVRGVPGRVDAVISEQQYVDAAALISLRRERNVRAPWRRRLLSSLVRCQSCNHRLHYVMAAGKPRLKCTYVQCNWYARGLAEWKIRAQVLEVLNGAHEEMARLAAEPVEQPEESQEDRERLEQLNQLLLLQQQGVPDLESSIAKLQRQRPIAARSAPNWQALSALLARPGVLELALDEELRALVLEFIDEIVYVGDPNRVEIRLRHGSGGNAP